MHLYCPIRHYVHSDLSLLQRNICYIQYSQQTFFLLSKFYNLVFTQLYCCYGHSICSQRSCVCLKEQNDLNLQLFCFGYTHSIGCNYVLPTFFCIWRGTYFIIKQQTVVAYLFQTLRLIANLSQTLYSGMKVMYHPPPSCYTSQSRCMQTLLSHILEHASPSKVTLPLGKNFRLEHFVRPLPK